MSETGPMTLTEHRAQNFGGRAICSCGDFNCASLDYAACGFALGSGLHCQGASHERD